MQIEKYKGLIRKLIRLLFIVVFELAFMYIWFSDINGLKLQPFENKGNWLMAAVYLVEMVLLLRVYGGFKIGHLERWNVILSQGLSLVICNSIMTVQIILMVGDMHLIGEILKSIVLLTIADIVISIVFVNLFDSILQKLYPPK